MKYVLLACLLSFALHAHEMQSSQGMISYVDTGGSGFPVVLIHGNSCSSKIFNKQIAALSDRYRMIAIDLPGHGQSGRASDPDTAYSIPGYASIVHELIQHLGLEKYALVGYSMGGNISLQYSQQWPTSLKGIVMVSSAPMKYSQEAFTAYPARGESYLSFSGQLTEPQAREFMSAGGVHVDDPRAYFTIEDAMKTDGSARAKMVASILSGKGSDETQIVSTLSVPLAVIVGEQDVNVGRDYIAQLNYRNLWHQKVQFISQAEHAIPLHQADALNALLESFLQEITANLQ